MKLRSYIASEIHRLHAKTLKLQPLFFRVMAEIDYLAIMLISVFSGFGGAIGAEVAKYILARIRNNKLLNGAKQ